MDTSDRILPAGAKTSTTYVGTDGSDAEVGATRVHDRLIADFGELARARMQDARPVASIVADTIRHAVVSGMLRAGQVLRQDELASMCGTSRMPVREALRQLESEGLVSHLPRRGFVVSMPTADDVTEIYELRGLLEGHAMRLAVPRLDDARMRRLEVLQGRMNRSGRPAELLRLRELFYRTLYEAAERPRLMRTILQLRAEVSPYLLSRQIPSSNESHAEFLDICRAREGRAAEQFITSHLRHVAAMLQGMLAGDRRGPAVNGPLRRRA